MATRKTRRQRDEERRQQRMRIVIGIFIIGIMVLSMVAFAVIFYNDGAQSGYDFRYEVRDDQLLVRTEQGTVPFYNFPQERFNLPDGSVSTLQNAQAVVISVDPQDNSTLEYSELVRFDLAQYFEVIAAKNTNSSSLSQFPVITCSDATAQTPVVVFSNTTDFSEDYCYVFSAQGIDTIFVRDAILYRYFDLL